MDPKYLCGFDELVASLRRPAYGVGSPVSFKHRTRESKTEDKEKKLSLVTNRTWREVKEIYGYASLSDVIYVCSMKSLVYVKHFKDSFPGSRYAVRSNGD